MPTMPMDAPRVVAPTALPASLTSLVGRESERAQILALLAAPDARLLTLTGPGGVGKSRLALDVARQASDQYPDGCVFVPLAAVRDPRQVGRAIARVLGLPDIDAEDPIRHPASRLDSSKTLVVLDNFEQVLDAATEVADLLTVCPHIKVLVTSRAPLAIRGEHRFPVPPLSLPDHSDASLAATLESDAVTLFVQQARAIHPDFTLTQQQAPIIANICRQLDGLPLAIELAAARTRVLSPAALLARLENRLHLLRVETRDLPDRQRTMHNAIGWSYDLLAPQEQLLFRRLAVFTGSVGLNGIEAVAEDARDSTEPTLTLVEHLFDHSLLQRISSPDDEPRFAMLETIRAFALEQLEASGEAERIRQRHVQWCLDVAAQVEGCMISPRSDAVLDVAERELDSLRSALDWAIEHDDAEAGLRLACGLWLFWVQRGHIGEGASWFERVLDQPGVTAPEVRGLRAKAMLGRTGLAEAQGDTGHSEATAIRCQELYRAANEPIGVAHSTHLLGVATLRRGETEQAVDHFRSAVATFANSGPDNQVWLALSLGLLPHALANLGETRAAHSYLDQASKIRDQLGNSWPNIISLPTLTDDIAEPLVEPPAVQPSSSHLLRALGSCVDIPPLTRRESEVLQLLAAGHSSREIADILCISPRTVSTHVQNILGKLEVNTRIAAVAKAHRLGLI